MKNEPNTKRAIVISRIFKVFAIIAKIFIVLCALCTVAIGIFGFAVASEVKIGNGEIGFSDNVINYEATDDNDFKITYDGDSYTIDNEILEIVDLSGNKIVDRIESVSVKKIIAVFELQALLILTGMVITFMMLGKGIRVLKNFIKEKSPFNKENGALVAYAARLEFLLLMINIVINAIVSALSSGAFDFKLDLNMLFISFGLYLIAWILSYPNLKEKEE